MRLLDFFVIVPLCWFAFKGFKNGLIYEVASILSLVVGVWLARRLSDGVASFLPNMPMSGMVAFIIIFVVTVLCIHLAARAATSIVKLVLPGVVDHLFGLLFGACKVLFVCSVILFSLQSVDRHEIILTKETKENALTYRYVEPIVPHAMHLYKTEKEK